MRSASRTVSSGEPLSRQVKKWLANQPNRDIPLLRARTARRVQRVEWVLADHHVQLDHAAQKGGAVGSFATAFLAPEPVLYHQGSCGFALFGASHLVLLALSLALAAAVVWRYRRLPAGRGGLPSPERRRVLLLAAGTACAILAAKDLSYVALDLFEPLFWPLHICNLCETAALVNALRPHSYVGSRMADLLFCWGPVACLAALVFPGWSPYCPAWSLASLCGFAEHALVLGCALCLVLGHDFRPHLRRTWFVLTATVAYGLAFRLANPLLGTNFFFVTNPAAAGPPGAWLVHTFGDPGFLAAYLLAAVGFWAATYGIWRAANHTATD